MDVQRVAQQIKEAAMREPYGPDSSRFHTGVLTFGPTSVAVSFCYCSVSLPIGREHAFLSIHDANLNLPLRQEIVDQVTALFFDRPPVELPSHVPHGLERHFVSAPGEPPT